MSVRLALDALIIKERLRTSDEEMVEQSRENPYLLYFLGFEEYSEEALFHPTMFVHFPKSLGARTPSEESVSASSGRLWRTGISPSRKAKSPRV